MLGENDRVQALLFNPNKLAPPYPGLVTGLAPAPDGKTLATRHADIGVVLWEEREGGLGNCDRVSRRQGHQLSFPTA